MNAEVQSVEFLPISDGQEGASGKHQMPDPPSFTEAVSSITYDTIEDIDSSVVANIKSSVSSNTIHTTFTAGNSDVVILVPVSSTTTGTSALSVSQDIKSTEGNSSLIYSVADIANYHTISAAEDVTSGQETTVTVSTNSNKSSSYKPSGVLLPEYAVSSSMESSCLHTLHSATRVAQDSNNQHHVYRYI